MPVWILFVVIIICYLACVIVYATSFGKHEIAFVLPKVKAIRNANKLIFLIEKNQLYSYGSLVTIAYQNENDEIETILGLGYVEDINAEGNMQAVFKKQRNSQEVKEIIQSLKDDKQSKLAIKIKPSITTFDRSCSPKSSYLTVHLSTFANTSAGLPSSARPR